MMRVQKHQFSRFSYSFSNKNILRKYETKPGLVKTPADIIIQVSKKMQNK